MNDESRVARQKILHSAIVAFAHKGYAGTSVQDILRAVKLSKPTLYYYFENKAGLFRAILDFAYDESFRLAKEAAAGETTCEAKLAAVATATFEFAESNKDLMRLVLATVFAPREEIPTGCVDAAKRRCHRDLVLEIVHAAQKSGELDARYDANDLMHGIFGAISHRVRSHLLLAEGNLDRRHAHKLVALFLAGARKKK